MYFLDSEWNKDLMVFPLRVFFFSQNTFRAETCLEQTFNERS